MEKIKINLDKITLAKLYEDMICFNFYKKDMQKRYSKWRYTMRWQP